MSLPHVGSPVAFPSGDVLREIAGHNIAGAAIGHFALGEYIYCEGSKASSLEAGMQIRSPEVVVRFPVASLVSRRSFIFARAGFGKSNLNKLLFSTLYAETPTVTKRGDHEVPVGTVIFDPDGEYFWPDDKGRSGLCDVPTLQDKLVVFTARKCPSPFYQSFVAGGIKLDLRRLQPADVISIALSPERQEQQNVRKLRALDQGRWHKLVDLIDQSGHQWAIEEVCRLLDLDPYFSKRWRPWPRARTWRRSSVRCTTGRRAASSWTCCSTPCRRASCASSTSRRCGAARP
jgi:hypothetical protein